MERRWWGAGLAGREHCMGSPASNGATCEHCMGPPASNGGQQRRWRGEHQGRKESCRPPNQDWVTPRERKAALDPSPPVGVLPVLALPPLLLGKLRPCAPSLPRRRRVHLASPPRQGRRRAHMASPPRQADKAAEEQPPRRVLNCGPTIQEQFKSTIQISTRGDI